MSRTTTGLVRAAPRALPHGRARIAWYGPALVWMVSAVGSGAVLFTPRIAARYEYALLWLALLTCACMWLMIREAARYTTVTGHTLLDGFGRLPGPRGWALWIIFLPQLLAAVVGVAGLSALVGSAVTVVLGGPSVVYTLVLVLGAAGIVALGEYDVIERLSRYMAVVLIGLSVVAAVRVAPPPATLAAGLVPRLPTNFDSAFVLPWVGTILAGSMGIVWFAYWTATHGYGGASALSGEHRERTPPEAPGVPAAPTPRLRRWLTLVSRAALFAVVSGACVILAFNVLGAELLAPRGLMPAGSDVARDLARLLEGVWGRSGFWALIVLTVFALGGSVIANQDGWSRSFADITLLLLGARRRPVWLHRRNLKRLYALVVTGLAPALLCVAVRDPVAIMSASGVVAAAHTPFIVLLILIVNRAQLPRALAPGLLTSTLLAAAGLFYLAISVLRLLA
ncbi:MAG: Nramp family divalent metal transporter [Gammaproteobacteria bacterium]